MQVMAASVHGAGILRRKFQSGVLGHGQRIHIAPDQDALAGLFASGQHHQTALTDLLHLIAHVFQLGFHIFHGLKQLVAHFRMTMEMPPVFHQLGDQLIGPFQIFVHWSIPPFLKRP